MKETVPPPRPRKSVAKSVSKWLKRVKQNARYWIRGQPSPPPAPTHTKGAITMRWKDLAAGKGLQGLQFPRSRQSHRRKSSAQSLRRTLRRNVGLAWNVSQDQRRYRRPSQHGSDQVTSIRGYRSSHSSSGIAFRAILRHYHRSRQRMALCGWKTYPTRRFPVPFRRRLTGQHPRTIGVVVERRKGGLKWLDSWRYLPRGLSKSA